jgi:alpha-glucosidase
MAWPWWQTTTIYQIYPRSFADGTGDGVGDLPGLLQRLDHLAWLGVGALWLSPINPSPMADFGYDVSDYCDVDPVYGSLADLDAVVAAAHDRNIKVLLDWVPNHTSDQHPWFVESRSSRTNPRRDWYVWRDPGPDGGPPNNWLSTFTGGARAWTLDEATGQYYLHQFLPQQPDLNWEVPEVAAAMHDTLRFWLDRGIDGFRVDVVQGLGRDLDRDDPPEMAGMPHSAINDSEKTHAIVRALRAVVDEYPGDRLLLGEVYLLSTAQVARYYGDGDELHLAFNFPFTFAPWDAEKLRRRIDQTHGELDPRGAWPTWVLSNHDSVRHRTRYGSEARARAALFLLLGLRGSPVLYAGEELGLEDAVVPPERVVDPGGRDGCRAPLPWTGDPDHGWGVTDPWLPWPPDADHRNVAAQVADPSSIAHLYRRLLAARRASPALQLGGYAEVEAPDGIVAWRRTADDAHRPMAATERVVAVNMGTEPAVLDVRGTVLVSSTGEGEGSEFTGTLDPDTAVLVEPS